MHTSSLLFVSALAIAPVAFASAPHHGSHAKRDIRHPRKAGAKRQDLPAIPTLTGNYATMASAALGTQAMPTADILSFASMFSGKPLPTAAGEAFTKSWGDAGSQVIDVSSLAESLGALASKATAAPAKRWEKDTGGTKTVTRGNVVEVQYWTSEEWGSGGETKSCDEEKASSTHRRQHHHHSTTTAAPVATTAVETTATTSAKAATITSSSVYDLGSVQDKSLSAHNVLRNNKGAVSLTWNETLADAAMAWANRCSFRSLVDLKATLRKLSTGEFADGGMSGAGSNVAYISGHTGTVEEQIKMWTDEESMYSSSNPTYADSYGHYTRPLLLNSSAVNLTLTIAWLPAEMVWKGTKTIGCAMVACDPLELNGDTSTSSTSNFLSCLYYPAGNIVGGSYFQENVEA
ncbi:hypothetical protein P7C70_g5219, partial [Phenoliferia sp. Uapishka_3]